MLLAAIPLVISACGSRASDPPPEVAATRLPAAAEAENQAEPIELVIFSNTGDSPETFDQVHGDIMKKKFPDYSFKYIQNKPGQTLPELLAQKQRIDLLYQNISYFFELGASGNLLYDMSELVKTQQIDLNKFEPTLIDGIRNSGGGKLYGLPVTNVGFVLYARSEDGEADLYRGAVEEAVPDDDDRAGGGPGLQSSHSDFECASISF